MLWRLACNALANQSRQSLNWPSIEFSSLFLHYAIQTEIEMLYRFANKSSTVLECQRKIVDVFIGFLCGQNISLTHISIETPSHFSVPDQKIGFSQDPSRFIHTVRIYVKYSVNASFYSRFKSTSIKFRTKMLSLPTHF